MIASLLFRIKELEEGTMPRDKGLLVQNGPVEWIMGLFCEQIVSPGSTEQIFLSVSLSHIHQRITIPTIEEASAGAFQHVF